MMNEVNTDSALSVLTNDNSFPGNPRVDEEDNSSCSTRVVVVNSSKFTVHQETEECFNTQLNNDDNTSSSCSTNTICTTIVVDPGKVTIHQSPDIEDASEAQSNVTENAMWSPASQRRMLQHNSHLPQDLKDQKTEISSPVEVNQTDTEARQEASPTTWQPFGEPVEVPQFRSVKLGKPTKKHKHSSSSKTTDSPKKEAVETTLNESTTQKINEQYEISTTTSVNGLVEALEEHTRSANLPVVVPGGRTSKLPPSQSPTITLLQKARDGQIPKGAVYIEEKPEDKAPLLPKNAVLIDQKVTIEGDKVHTDSYYAVPTSIATGEVTTQIIKAPSKYDGIGPTEYGIPMSLRTGVKDEYGSDWYKTMYRSLHKDPTGSRGHFQTVHLGGYSSEPEFDRKDGRRHVSTTSFSENKKTAMNKEFQAGSSTISTTGRIQPVVEPVKRVKIDNDYIFEASASGRDQDFTYRNQPRSIAEYEPGRSSLADREFQKHEHFRHSPRAQRSYDKKWPNAVLCDGYESDSMLIRKSIRSPQQLDPEQQKTWYKEIQKGGEIPFSGLRKSAPAKPKESAHQYQETDVNIHFKSPIRNLEKEYIEEEDLRKRQEEAMKKFYAEERERKLQQQTTELEMRRHCDNFTPSQKSPIPLNRYDNPFEIHFSSRLSPSFDTQRTLAQVLFPFVAQSTREISLNKDDIVYVNKQIDKNWYEGEHHGFVGIFPVSYVTVIPSEKANFHPRDVNEGYAVVKYNFRAKTPTELSLFQGERVILTRRIDHNWYEGRLGTKKGIFPASYVDVIQSVSRIPLHDRTAVNLPKPPVSPIQSVFDKSSSFESHFSSSSTVADILRDNQNQVSKGRKEKDKSMLSDSLRIDTYNEPIPYRSLYSYYPQNEDELELKEGDTVYVMEKCDDGWYVGTSLRSGLFGTFPGNYVERI